MYQVPTRRRGLDSARCAICLAGGSPADAQAAPKRMVLWRWRPHGMFRKSLSLAAQSDAGLTHLLQVLAR
ncbi:uncharacterized protein TrAFT101_006600 [Trichoderma asperellum]|uniref:uncharacterized protein n=1 Tax=Trichoderma asperellum TaxID=101201 RepID=UPI003327939B|nr:hypothetical protein TrAFT101_006600 [Trichoderma asperellum]